MLCCADPMAYTHLLFDFFGTLVEYSPSRTEQGFERAHAVAVEAGASFEYGAFLGAWEAHFEAFDRGVVEHAEYSMDQLCTAFLREHRGSAPDPGDVTRFRDAYLAEWCTSVREIPGVAELLQELCRRYRLVLVTNTHHAEVVHEQLRTLRLEPYFEAVVTSVEHGRRKPSTCIFERALDACGATRELALFIGDSYPADYQGATAAGMDCLLIDPQRRQPVPDAHRLTHVLDLRARLLVA